MAINYLEDFITQMPKELKTTTEKMRHLYLELGKRSFYDTSYDYIMFDEENSIFRYKLYQNPNIIICTTIIKQLAELAAMANIKARICIENSHYFLSYYDEKGIEHKTDITYDLKNIQFGCKTTHFASQSISDDVLKEIDLKLGYITQERGYADEYWYLVKEAIQNENLTQKQQLDIVLNNLAKFGDLSKLGERELYNLYQKYIKFCMPDNKNLIFSSSRSTKEPEEKCIIDLKQGKQRVSYLLNFKTRLFEQQKKEKINSHIPSLPENER